jgi:hypothetical protein
MNLVAVTVIPVQSGLLAWLEAPGCRTLRSIKADLSHIDAWLTVLRARSLAMDAKRNGAFTPSSTISD